ncbi:MAG: hypothetical protein R3202_09930 [Candidatus Competibacterales bacterium]|nr:hypothetical protein [Candidatus Competibacterales bacterium]
MKRNLSLALALTLLLALALPPVASAQTEARLKSVQTLIEKSSGARQIESSGSPEARARRDQARDYYRQAEQALQSGNRKAADEALLQATKAMLEAVRMTDTHVVEDKRRADFQNRLDSVNALLDAHERIATEKGHPGSNAELRRLVNAKINQARQMLDRGRLDDARQVLDQTYIATKTAIEELRGGDTLVRSLNFANKEEEYHYEIDRNDTHQMLVTVLLEEKMKDPRISQQVNQFMDKAKQLRARAEQQASRGDYDSAVSTLEDSTKEVVRAIRMAGIYIPG